MIHVEVQAEAIDIAAELGALHYKMHSGLAPIAEAAVLEDAYARQRDWLARAERSHAVSGR